MSNADLVAALNKYQENMFCAILNENVVSTLYNATEFRKMWHFNGLVITFRFLLPAVLVCPHFFIHEAFPLFIMCVFHYHCQRLVHR
jgi:hypothetical protein